MRTPPVHKAHKRHRLKDHLQYLLLVLLLACSILLLVAAYKRRELIYPQPHVNQESPQKYVNSRAKNLPAGLNPPVVIEHGSRDKHQIALTFDADMTQAMKTLLDKGVVKSWYNRPIKDTIDREGVRATVFLTGLWARTYPKEAYELAHDPLIEIGDHSFGHPAFSRNCFNLPFIDNRQDQDEVQSAQVAIAETTGIIPKYFRFPGGCYDKIDVETIAKSGLTIVHWDVAAGDGFNNDPNSIYQRVISRVQNGSIVVFHIHGGSYAPKTNDALVKIIPELKKRGYKFVTISQMLESN